MIVAAYPELELNEDADVTFSDASSFPDWAEESIEILSSLGVVEGTDGKFNPADNVTRAETAAFVHRTEVEDERKDVPIKVVAPAVESVSAINDTTIKSGVETTLKLSVNGKEELTKTEFEEKYEGYTVEFKYNFSGATAKERTGVVTKTSDFKYAVQVTDAEGNLVPETVQTSDFTTVKVADAAVATEVTSVGLEVNGEEYELDYIIYRFC